MCWHRHERNHTVRRGVSTTVPRVHDDACHAVVTARVDYWNMVLTGAPRSVTDRLQRVLNAAARLVSEARKYGRGVGLVKILHADLYWLDVADLVRYRLARQSTEVPDRLLRRCLVGDCCVSDVASCTYIAL